MLPSDLSPSGTHTLHGRIELLTEDLSPERALQMVHLLNCTDCSRLALPKLLGWNPVVRISPAREESSIALAKTARLHGLTFWLRDSHTSILEHMLYSAYMFAALRMPKEAAVSRCLLGLYLAEKGLFDCALTCLAARSDIDRAARPWLQAFSDLSAALCLAKSGLPVEATEIIRAGAASGPALPNPNIVLRVQWLYARVRASLGELEPALRNLSLVFDRLADNRQETPTLLAALDILSLNSASFASRLSERLSRLRHPLIPEVVTLCQELVKDAIPATDLPSKIDAFLARLPSTERFDCLTLETKTTLGVMPCRP